MVFKKLQKSIMLSTYAENMYCCINVYSFSGNKVYGANMGPTWGRQDPGGPHVGHMNFAIWVYLSRNLISWPVVTNHVILSICNKINLLLIGMGQNENADTFKHHKKMFNFRSWFKRQQKQWLIKLYKKYLLSLDCIYSTNIMLN